MALEVRVGDQFFVTQEMREMCGNLNGGDSILGTTTITVTKLLGEEDIEYEWINPKGKKCTDVFCVKRKHLTNPVYKDNKPTTFMEKLTSTLKRVLNSDLQAMYKAGYINGGLELTSKGQSALFGILLSAHEAELGKLATEELEEAEKTCK